MKKIIKHCITTWLLLLLGSAMVMASLPDDNDDFNPSNPPEPNAKFKVEVQSPDFTYCSGSGNYRQGETAYISTSAANENYQFAYWKKDGEKYSDQRYFQYVMTDRNVKFEAVYNYTPANPSEPTPMNKYRLYLSTEDAECCSFNRTSGEKVEAGESVWLYAYLSQGYVFKGWYKGDELLSTSQNFYYTMPSEDTSLSVRFVYSPSSPSDPNSTEKDEEKKDDSSEKEDDKKDDSSEKEDDKKDDSSEKEDDKKDDPSEKEDDKKDDSSEKEDDKKDDSSEKEDDKKDDSSEKEDDKKDDSSEKEDDKKDDSSEKEDDKKDDETTGINHTPSSDASSSSKIYRLDGRIVPSITQKGIYIINHKKVIVN